MAQPPAVSNYILPNSSSQSSSNKRVFSGSSSAFVDPDVIEIPPQVFRKPKLRKRKQVFAHEVIDIDNDEDSSDVMVLDEMVATKNKGKGKAVKNNIDGSGSYQPKGAALGSHNLINLDSFDGQINLDSYDGQNFDLYDFMDVDYSSMQDFLDNADIPTGVGVSLPLFGDPALSKKKMVHGMKPPLMNSSSMQNPVYGSQSPWPASKINSNPLASVESYMPWGHNTWKPELNSTFVNYSTYPSPYGPFDTVHIPPKEVVDVPQNQECAKNNINADEANILNKFKLFKQFDNVEGHSDHYYANTASSMKQPSKKWVKKIQEEWKILEKDLPDTIFVRVYESRMDLLRAVIVGAEGTPYHDGLFFFDVFFPDGYPSVPPLVHYHSGGLRINPNLYNCGKVCLSLLNTWSGNKNEMWIPGKSTMLQVLVSIQALILNQNPFFNEPGFVSMNGTKQGEIQSRNYNENTFILSLKTMVYTMRKPPKHFKDYVVGHFFKCARDILIACKAYMNGAQVGCLVKGGVQDVDEGDKSCSQQFKTNVAGFMDTLVKEFTKIGAKNCENFLSEAKRGVTARKDDFFSEC